MQHVFSLLQQYALPFIVVISAVVFVHEFGHYLVARLCGIRVESFSIGFGRKLFGWTDKSGTAWQVAWLPLGGYVKMFGDADAASTPDEKVKTMTEAEKSVAFYHQKVGKRMAVVAAGPVSNYIFAILVLAVLFIFQGQPFSPPMVGALQENGVAAQAGVLAGDKVTSIDGKEISRFEDIKRLIGMNSGAPVSMVVERAGKLQTLSLTPEITVQKDRFGGEHRMGRIGIVSDKVEHIKRQPLEALRYATLETWNMSVDTLKAVGQIVTGVRGSEELGGPIRIAEMSGDIAQDGLWAMLWFIAILSINLGLINLFPVPLLDGGHLLFFSLEKLMGRPLGEKTQEAGMRVGFVLVVSLMLFATWNDLVHLDVLSKIKALFS
ncbi:MAG: RIP metalloprotease RseP [Bdellovibrionales bacterium]|jgi:regulator of sigma E protease